MTDEMYEELKARLTEEGLICKKKDYNESVKGEAKRKELYFLDRAYKHFRARQEDLYTLSRGRGWGDWTNHNLSLISYGWDNIRKLVLWSYGVNGIRYLPDDKQDEINDFAIKIINDVFDQYSKMWERASE